MRCTILAIGKASRRSPENQIIEEYTKRLPWTVVWKEFDVKQSLSGEQRKKKEGELLLAAIPVGAKVIVLDERGKLPDSVAFASTLECWQDDGVRDVALLIGGAEGHTEAVRARADMVLSLGKMTWPHKLVRVLLAEQLYRAYTIIQNHPYHKA